jgi:hypothetical protein
MLKARQGRVIGKDGIPHRGRIYLAPELSGLGGERGAGRVHAARSAQHRRLLQDRFLATATDQADLTDAQKCPALRSGRSRATASDDR